MPFKGKMPFQYKDAGKLWNKDSKGQGFGSMYGGNRTSAITKDIQDNTVQEDRASDMF